MSRKRHVPGPNASEQPPGTAPTDPRRATAGPGKPAAHTLLVRLWQEARNGVEDPAIWRGTVSDLRGRQLGSFSTAAELAGILGEMAGLNVLVRVTCTEVSGDPRQPPHAP